MRINQNMTDLCKANICLKDVHSNEFQLYNTICQNGVSLALNKLCLHMHHTLNRSITNLSKTLLTMLDQRKACAKGFLGDTAFKLMAVK